MDIQSLQNTYSPQGGRGASGAAQGGAPLGFDAYLKSFSTEQKQPRPVNAAPGGVATQALSASGATFESRPTLSARRATAAYSQESAPTVPGRQSDWEKYREDQLLSNPGGDAYYAGRGGQARPDPDGRSFLERVGKDIGDAVKNVGNFFKNIFFGAETHYRDTEGKVQEGEQRGLVGSLADFVKDMGCVLTLGVWRPDGEAAPKSFGERGNFIFSKGKEALGSDLIAGVGGSLNHMGEDLVLAGLNLVEAIPDATIGNFKAGEKLVSKVFDNGQVAVDYLTDIIPAGEAWMRVHSSDLTGDGAPILYNLKMPEHYRGDTRWSHIRNTPFRKSIETIGSLLADVATLKLANQINTGSEKKD